MSKNDFINDFIKYLESKDMNKKIQKKEVEDFIKNFSSFLEKRILDINNKENFKEQIEVLNMNGIGKFILAPRKERTFNIPNSQNKEKIFIKEHLFLKFKTSSSLKQKITPAKTQKK